MRVPPAHCVLQVSWVVRRCSRTWPKVSEQSDVVTRSAICASGLMDAAAHTCPCAPCAPRAPHGRHPPCPRHCPTQLLLRAASNPQAAKGWKHIARHRKRPPTEQRLSLAWSTQDKCQLSGTPGRTTQTGAEGPGGSGQGLETGYVTEFKHFLYTGPILDLGYNKIAHGLGDASRRQMSRASGE
jgi:hypothetical protein